VTIPSFGPVFDGGAFDAGAFDTVVELPIFDPTAVAASAPLASIDHVAAGLARLPQQWRDKPHMINMLVIFLARYNDLEAAYQDLLLLRSINTANANDPTGFIGAQLDQIGAKVGQRRNGLNNDDYRRYCRAKIRANNSNGRGEDLIAIASLVLNDPTAYIKVEQQNVKTVQVTIFNILIDNNLATILINFLRISVAGGERLLQVTHPTDEAHMFALGDSASPGSSALTGLGDSTEGGQPDLTPYTSPGTTGGQLSDVRE
jgi:hypothetical protein